MVAEEAREIPEAKLPTLKITVSLIWNNFRGFYNRLFKNLEALANDFDT